MLPRRGEGEWTPLLLCAALLAASAAQLAAPVRTELPDPSPLAPRRAREPAPPMIPDYPAALRAPIFTPDRTPGEAASATDAGTAPSLQLLGAATTAHGASVIVKTPDGGAHAVRQGEVLQGWRLVSATLQSAVFDGPIGRTTLIVGGPPSTPAGASADASANTPTTPAPAKPGQTTASEPTP